MAPGAVSLSMAHQILPSLSPVELLLELAMDGDVAAFRLEMAKHPLHTTAGPDVYDDRGPLHMAAWHGRLEIVKLILASPEVSAEAVNARDKFGYTALHLAVRSEHVEVVRAITTDTSLARYDGRVF